MTREWYAVVPGEVGDMPGDDDLELCKSEAQALELARRYAAAEKHRGPASRMPWRVVRISEVAVF